MPLSEFLRMARGKLESSQQKPAPADFSARSENDLVELVWENGHVVMQGQSSRVTRSPTLSNSPSNTYRVRDARFGKSGGVGSVMNEMEPVVPSGDMDISQDDDIVPWLSYPMDDALGQNYVSEILPEISGLTANGMSTRNSFVSVDKRAFCEQAVSNLQSGGSSLKVSPPKDRLFGSWLHKHRQTSDAFGSGVTDISSNNSTKHLDAVFENPARSRDTVDGSASMMMERQNITLPTNTSDFLNFSHFSRPANHDKANPPKSDATPKAVSPVVVRNDIKEKGSAANCSNPIKSICIEKSNRISKDNDSNGSGKLPMVNSREPFVKETQGSCPRERVENLCQETSSKNVKALHLGNNENSAKGAPEGERTLEPMVASSSVGSGNSADRVSCEQTHHSKRKFHDTEDSECRSDDLETESIDAKKRTYVRGSKRSRAAEVHNLSERRRRDRINEKMRALQELIPNCNKFDKASMLDEAIEYLKTLQLQVQIMSMSSGLYMSPMMFPTGMQHMHPAQVPHFQPMGFGMGMTDMNGGFPVHPLHFPQFPSPVSGLATFQRMPGPNIQAFGHPGQALPMTAPRTSFVPLAPRPPLATSSMGSNALRNGSASQIMNSTSMCTAEASKSNQLQPRNEHSGALQHEKPATDASAAPSSASDINKEPG